MNNVFNENSVSKTISDQFYIEKNRIKYYIHDTAGQVSLKMRNCTFNII